MRAFSFRPAFTVRGRAFKGLRGWAGKPLHPPLTDVPVGAIVLAAAFDVISFVGGSDETWARDFYRAGTYALVGGAIVAVFAALTGLWDRQRSTEPGTQARRTVNAHALTMVAATVLVVVGIVVRLVQWDEPATTGLALVLSVAAAVLTFMGGALGGSLVFDYGFNVETAGDHPVWHRSEVDVLPGGRRTHEPGAAAKGSRSRRSRSHGSPAVGP